MNSRDPIPIEDIQAARERIKGTAIRTPLVRLNVNDAPSEIYLKLENLQPTGAFKLRGMYNSISLAGKDLLDKGVWTLSSGNAGQALAWCASRLGLHCAVAVLEYAADAKLAAITRFGAKIVKVTMAEAIQIDRTHSFNGMEGVFIHPFSSLEVMAGNGTIGLEILEDLPDVGAIVAPYGGGGLCCGVASAVRSLKPDIKVYASEVETGAPLAASLAAGEPVEVKHTPSLVDGISAPVVFPGMFHLANQLLDGSLVATLDEVASAIRIVAERNHVIAEGAAATSVAAALSGKAGPGKVVSVVSGGNIDSDRLAKILQGQTP